MGNEATSLLPYQDVVARPMYEIAHTTQCIERAIQAIVTARVTRVALVTVTLHLPMDAGKNPQAPDMLTRSLCYYFDDLRCLVRKTDVAYILNTTFYFLLLNADSEGGRIVQTRLWDALLWRVHNAHEQEILRPYVMAVGNAAYPDPYSTPAECVEVAAVPAYSLDLQPEKTLSKAISTTLEQHTMPTDMDATTREEELATLARKLGVPYLSLLPRKKPQQVQRMVTLKLAHELQCYPLGRERGMLSVALANPQDSSVLARLQEATGLHIFPVLTNPQELQAALSQLF